MNKIMIKYNEQISGDAVLTVNAVGPAGEALFEGENSILGRRSDLRGLRWNVGFVPYLPFLKVDEK